jgi:hypothetical protein
MVLAAYVWHFWIGVLLVGGAVLTLIALAVAYLGKVQSPKYGPGRRGR